MYVLTWSCKIWEVSCFILLFGGHLKKLLVLLIKVVSQSEMK